MGACSQAKVSLKLGDTTPFRGQSSASRPAFFVLFVKEKRDITGSTEKSGKTIYLITLRYLRS